MVSSIFYRKAQAAVSAGYFKDEEQQAGNRPTDEGAKNIDNK